MSDEPIEISSVPCPNCGHQILIGHAYCEGCGIGDPSTTMNPPVTIKVTPPPEPGAQPDSPPVMPPPSEDRLQRCPKCGHSVPSGTTYCANCGTGVRSTYANGKPAKSGMPVWAWILIIVFALPFLCCGGCFVYLYADSAIRGMK